MSVRVSVLCGVSLSSGMFSLRREASLIAWPTGMAPEQIRVSRTFNEDEFIPIMLDQLFFEFPGFIHCWFSSCTQFSYLALSVVTVVSFEKTVLVNSSVSSMKALSCSFNLFSVKCLFLAARMFLSEI